MISRFFIDRPIFAWVIAIVVMLAGVLAIRSLPIAQYPSIAPPAVSITASYPGADAKTLENTVTQVIEQQMKGLDHLEYIASSSDGAGSATVTLTFAQSTNPDIAQVQVQNKLQQATPLLPQEVQQQGLVVAKAVKNFALIIAFYSKNGQLSGADLGDYVASKLQDPISRVTGVGDTQLFGSQYAMRIWVDPYKLNNYKLTTADVTSAIQAQDAQVSAGQVGGLPQVKGQQLNATVTAQSRLQKPEQFADIVLRTNTNGATVHLRDVARVERDADNYTFNGRFNGHPAAGFAIKLAPGANLLDTVKAVKARVAELSSSFPADATVAYPFDSTPFVQISIEEVVKTLLEAIALVFCVMFLFLQNWRATLIPTIAVPVVLLGTFAVLAIFGYSINTLTMFAMVLAIGLLVDDAIVVVENVERIMHEEGLSPREATRKSMDEITGALIGIALVLCAVFVPMAFFGGSTGVIYRQFAVTIVSAMVLSVIVALVVTPALCATLLKPSKRHGEQLAQTGFFGWFNRNFDRGVGGYRRGLTGVIARPVRWMLIFGAVVLAMALLFVRLPSSFFPDEDQGVIFASYQLPPGATMDRTIAIGKEIEHHFLVDEKADVDGLFTVAGFGFGGQGQNTGLAFIHLKDWSVRHGPANRAPAIAGRAMGAFAPIRDALVFAFVPPAVLELGNATGFDLELEDVGGLGHDKLMAARNQFLGMASQDHTLAAVRPNGEEDTPQLKLDVDRTRAGALGLSLADVNTQLSTAWGGAYVTDYIDAGRVKRVYVEGDAPYRTSPEDFGRWYVRGTSGTMAPFSAFSNTRWTVGSPRLERYNGLPAVELLGQAARGKSSGAAIAEVKDLIAKLPPGIGYEWTGLTYEEEQSGAQAPALYAISLLVVFLCLAALYESWTVPVSVILVVPLGIFGAVLAATLRGLTNDVYFQVGLLTTIGLSAKNAILIVEFAESGVRAGKGAIEAAMEAARLRLRPILMTSLAFIAGVTPLALSTGAGAGSQNDIGTGVIGGMVSATILAVFFVPLFFVVVLKVFPSRKVEPTPEAHPASQPEAV
jgi:hydrophobe/amphiphile efflux-1 (HAE1) family protein